MNKFSKHSSLFYLLAAALFSWINGPCQTRSLPAAHFATDSLKLESVVNEVIKNYPTIKEAEEAINMADAKIGFARSGYLPDADITASYTRIGPVPELSIPQFGTFKMYPNDNYVASLNLKENLYDFGKTDKAVALEKAGKDLSSGNLEQSRQNLTIRIMMHFHTLAYLQEAIRIKEEQLKTLNEHLAYVTKKKETGSSTQYEILSTQVRISAAESQKTDLEMSLDNELSAMNSLLGRPHDTPLTVKENWETEPGILPADTILNYAFIHRDEINILESQGNMEQIHYQLVRASNKPVISLFASAGYKNGYFPEIDKIKSNYVAGLSLRVPLFDANRTRYNLQQVNSSLKKIDLEKDKLRRDITDDVISNMTGLQAAVKKVKQFQLQLDQARQAYKLAKTSFESGVITNLDLLDASTSVSESWLSLLKARVDLKVSQSKLKAASGVRLY